jgi:tRNA wybutosine-synthesizing protein 3
MSQSTFILRKEKILQQLSVPDDEYNDLSPKGSVDEGIKALINDINSIEGLVTTSSCAGRVSVYLDGSYTSSKLVNHRDENLDPKNSTLGSKGGGQWLYISHDPLHVPAEVHTATSHFHSLFQLQLVQNHAYHHVEPRKFVHFKYEAMV